MNRILLTLTCITAAVACGGEATEHQSAAAEGSALITHGIGLHARPSVKLTKLAKTFASAIHLRGEGVVDWVDAGGRVV